MPSSASSVTRWKLPADLAIFRPAISRCSPWTQTAAGRPADERRRLGDLVLVVREDVVDAAGVQVEPVAQVAPGHRRALEVPARVALAPARRSATCSARLAAGGLPQGEVGGVALVGLDLAAVAGPQLVEGVARQPAVAGNEPTA